MNTLALVLSHPARRLAAALLLAVGVFCSVASPTRAAPDQLVMIIQPALSEERTRQSFQPLADFISKVTGIPCVIRTSPNFLAYWSVITRNSGFDLALDAAHFADYRAQKFGFKILAKAPDTLTQSLVVHENDPVLDPEELIGKPVATLGPPSISAARLNSLYPNPLRQPIVVEVASFEDGIEKLVQRKVRGAILPTPLVAQQMARGVNLIVVTTTEPMPHTALSAAPTLDPALRDKIRAALLNARNTEEGRKMLEGIGFMAFDPATEAMYAGQSNLLKAYWGY